MNDQRSAQEFLDKFADDLDAEIRDLTDDLNRRVQALAEKRDTARKAAQMLRDTAITHEDGAPQSGESAAPAISQPAPAPDIAEWEIDYSRARNLLSRLRAIGKGAPDGVLRVGPVTNRLIADGVSGAKFNNLRRAVDKTFRDHPELFEYVGPGTYRYNAPHPESALNTG